MYYVIIVVLLNIVCAALIAAPSHPFCEITVEFLGSVPSPLSPSTAVNICDYGIHFIPKHEEQPWFGEKGNIDLEKEGPFSPAALLELIWIFEILTRNRRTLEELQVQTRVYVSLLLSCPCASLELKLLALTSTSWWKMLASISKEVKCSQHIGKTAPSSAPSFS